MNFAHELREAGRLLSALQMAEAVSPLLSPRTVENWLNGSNAPAAWMRDTILTRIRRANECAERRQAACAMQAPNVKVSNSGPET